MESGETFPSNLYSGLVYLVVPAKLEKTSQFVVNQSGI